MSVFTRINKRGGPIRWDTLFNNGMTAAPTASGKRVSEETALKYSVVYAAATLITDAVSFLSPEAFTRDTVTGSLTPTDVPRWIASPHPDMRRADVWSQLLMSALLWGNGYALLVRRDSDGAVIGMFPLRPQDVQCEWDPNKAGYRRYKVNGGKWLSSGDVLHIMGPSLPGVATGMSIIRQAREAIGLGLTLEEFGARYFGQGSMAKVVIKIPGKVLDEQQARAVVANYERYHRGAGNWHRPALLSGPTGTDIENISIPPEDAQFLQSREFQALDVARWFRVPPHRVGIVSKQSSWGSGLAEENMAMVQHCFRPWIRRLEDVFTRYSPGGEDRGLRIRLKEDELLRGTFKEQVEAWGMGIDKKIFVPNEARKALGLGPIEGGDKLVEAPAPPPMQPGQQQPPQQQNSFRYNPHHGKDGKFASGSGGGGGGAGVSDAQAAQLADRTKADGGFTFNTKTGEYVTSGYAVSPYPEHSGIVPFEQFGAKDIKDYSDQNSGLLSKQDHFLGSWHNPDDNKVYLDISIIKPTQAEAETVAKDHNQIAIFNLSTFETINTGGTGRSRLPFEPAERRELTPSVIERMVDRSPTACPECEANTDPNNVPVHPGCHCNAKTLTISRGVSHEEAQRIAEAYDGVRLSTFGSNTEDVPTELQIIDESISVISKEAFRFADFHRWMEETTDWLFENAEAINSKTELYAMIFPPQPDQSSQGADAGAGAEAQQQDSNLFADLSLYFILAWVYPRVLGEKQSTVHSLNAHLTELHKEAVEAGRTQMEALMVPATATPEDMAAAFNSVVESTPPAASPDAVEAQPDSSQQDSPQGTGE